MYKDVINFRHHTLHFVYIENPQIIKAVFGAKRWKWNKEGKFLSSVCGLIGLQKRSSFEASRRFPGLLYIATGKKNDNVQ